MAKSKDIRLDRYVLAGSSDDTNYISLKEVREMHGSTVLFSNSKIVVVRRKMGGGCVGDVLVYTEAKP